MAFNGINQILNAAIDGYGVGFVPEGSADEKDEERDWRSRLARPRSLQVFKTEIRFY